MYLHGIAFVSCYISPVLYVIIVTNTHVKYGSTSRPCNVKHVWDTVGLSNNYNKHIDIY